MSKIGEITVASKEDGQMETSHGMISLYYLSF